MYAWRQRLTGSMTVMAGIAALIAVVGCSRMADRTSTMRTGDTARVDMALSGSQEVPPVNSQASGISSITVTGDKNISGRVETTGMNGTVAHIHQGAPGQNGPPIVTLVKSGENTWSVPANTILSSAQFDAYRRGHLYVNVHSAANPDGEIRGQLKP
jgi:hypothetical protein